MSAPTVSREVFMRRLRRSGLLTPEQMQHAYEAAAETADGRQLGKLLVERRILTRFQVRMLLAGRTEGFLLGQYKILEPIGQGGMGRVFKAEHTGMGRLVAIKVLASDLVQTERARQLFEREVKLAARLQHPNIVTAYDADHVGGRYFLVLEYVEGPDLQSLVQRDGPLPVGVACELIRQAALGLQYAHERGMVHRDIKPSNLLVQRNNPLGAGPLLKILDFGLARLHASESEIDGESVPFDRRTVIGTPDYLSPEQARDWHEVYIRSGLYSLGCTLYFLLTGQPPFPGGQALEKLVRHLTERPAPLTQLRKDVPLAVVEIVETMMAKNPLERYQVPLDAALALAPHAVPSTTFLGSSGDSDHDTFTVMADSSTWPSQRSALTAVAAGSVSVLPPPIVPEPKPRRSWSQKVTLAVGLLLGFVAGMGFLGVLKLFGLF
ncbi:MAG: serine/threonine protein kinase [Gemmataceae bacterium]|nr:serine/threonine protein kinase [Gemmataceae bacterium]